MLNVRQSSLLYLGFAFPPGVSSLFPGLNPAGHALETQMLGELRKHFDVRSTGVLPFSPPEIEAADPRSGIDHELLLLEKSPELFHRLASLVRLKRQYREWVAAGWKPDLVLVYNLSPIYNAFLLWLRRQAERPTLVLMLLDSAKLGRRLPWLKHLRHRLKPMCVPDADMLSVFDACVGLSKTTEKYFTPRQVPFLWLPGGCNPGRAVSGQEPGRISGPIRFGYYGALGAHSGVREMAEIFVRSPQEATLDICGYGKGGEELEALARHAPKLRFRGLLTPDECLLFGRDCDVLINPRPLSHGNENNFASKLFDYALSGRAILTSKLSGVEHVLGPEADYFNPHDFERGLAEEMAKLAMTPRKELHRRGAAIQQRVVRQFSWEEQGGRLAEFLERVAIGVGLVSEPAEALAA